MNFLCYNICEGSDTMIFDFIDTPTKVSFMRMLRGLLKQTFIDVDVIKSQVNQDELFEGCNTEETILKLVAIGVITPVISVTDAKSTLKLNLKTAWKRPEWLSDKRAITDMNNHIDWMLSVIDDVYVKQVDTTISHTIYNFRVQYLVNAVPFNVLPTREWDSYLINSIGLTPEQLLKGVLHGFQKGNK